MHQILLICFRSVRQTLPVSKFMSGCYPATGMYEAISLVEIHIP